VQLRIIVEHVLRSYGLPPHSVHTVTKATTLSPSIMRPPSGMASCFPTDLARINRLIVRLILTGYLPHDSPSFKVLVASAELNLLNVVIFDSSHILRPLFPFILSRCPGLRKRFHPFTLPPKDS